MGWGAEKWGEQRNYEILTHRPYIVRQIATKEIFEKGKGKKKEKNNFELTTMASVDFPSPVAARTVFNSDATGAPSPNSDPPGRKGLSEEGVRLLLSRGVGL